MRSGICGRNGLPAICGSASGTSGVLAADGISGDLPPIVQTGGSAPLWVVSPDGGNTAQEKKMTDRQAGRYNFLICFIRMKFIVIKFIGFFDITFSYF